VNAYWVNILTNSPRSTVIYIGVTNSLEVRQWQHQHPTERGFTWRYNAHTLVYYELFPDPQSAISREKQLKGWRRSKKDALIDKFNPGWRDLGAALSAATLTQERRGPSTSLHSAQDDCDWGNVTSYSHPERSAGSLSDRSAVEGPRRSTERSR
jgi:putative endonuclease